jgi:hypothetical protein
MNIPDVKACTAAGHITAGADCGTINSAQHTSMSGDEFIKWLNPSSDPKDSHASAICFSAHDAGALITMMETVCTELKSNCTQEMHTQIENLKAIHENRFNDLMVLDPQ